MTIGPACPNFVEAAKGLLQVCKLADFVVLTADHPLTFGQIKVIAMIKEGQSIYKASSETLQSKAEAGRGMGKPYSDFLIKLAASAQHNDGCVSGVIAEMAWEMPGDC